MELNRKTLWSGGSDRVLFCFDLCGVVFSENLGLTVSFSQTSVPYLCYLLGTLCVCFLSNLVLLVWQSNELGIVFLLYRRRNWGKIYYLKVSSVWRRKFFIASLRFALSFEMRLLIFFNKKFYLCVCLTGCQVGTGILKSQKRASDSLDLELQANVNYPAPSMDAGNWSQSGLNPF